VADRPQVNQSDGIKDRPSFAVDGNRLTPLVGGRERLDALIALIDGAHSSLRLLYYIYCPDRTGRLLRDAMARAVSRGVDVRLIVDGFGCSVPADFFKPLQADGADICRFIPRLGRRYLLRNHQKLALADGKVAMIGGFNISDDYFDDADGWRDLGLIVEGPAANRLAGYFDALSRWTHREKSRLRDLRRALARWSEPKGGPMRWLLGGPTRRLSPWSRAVKTDMERARGLRIIASYFAPSPLMMRRIERVALRGGVSRVVTPAKTDHAVAVAAARHCYARLLRRGVKVFEYQPQKLHTKLFVIDDTVHIGSANFDIRSTFLNLEIMLRIEDAAFAKHMRDYFEGEVAESDEVTDAEHARAGWWTRAKWSAAYFIMAVLDARVTRGLNFGVDD
jgi:cardiolipin synthase